MASLLTDIATNQASQLVTSRVDGFALCGSQRVARGRYTVTGLEVTGDIISIVSLPVGAIVIPGQCWVISDGIDGTDGLLSKIGDAANDDRYCASDIELDVAASVALTPTAGEPPFAITAGNETLKATLTFSDPLTVGAIIDFVISYIDRP